MLLASREPEALMTLIKHWDVAQPHFPSLKHRPWLYHSWRSLCTLGEEQLECLLIYKQYYFFFLPQDGNELVYKKYDKMSLWFSLRFLLLAALWIWTSSPGSSLYDSKPHPVIVRGMISCTYFLVCWHSWFSFSRPQFFASNLSAKEPNLWHS